MYLKYKWIPNINHIMSVSQISTIYIIIQNVTHLTPSWHHPVIFSADDWGVQSPLKRIAHLGSMKPFSVSLSQDPQLAGGLNPFEKY